MSISLIVFGTFWLYPWSNNAEAIAQKQGLSAFTNPVYSLNVQGVLIGSVVQAILLLVIIGISVIKPWGRRSVIKEK